MLILTRKIGESIQIGDDIRIKIIDVTRQFVKVGIDAPRSVVVHREEIYERIREENIKAGQVDTPADLSKAAMLLKKKDSKLKLRKSPMKIRDAKSESDSTGNTGKE